MTATHHGKQVLDDGVDRLELLVKVAGQLGRALVRRSVTVAKRRSAAGEQETETDGDLRHARPAAVGHANGWSKTRAGSKRGPGSRDASRDNEHEDEEHPHAYTCAETAEMLVIDVILRGIRVSDAAAHLLIPALGRDHLAPDLLWNGATRDELRESLRAEDDLVALMHLNQNRNHLYMRELRDAL
ncbi:hypothetical protein T492DRAFT_914197 [Pavlovales sp. CCMP2436]|nr:hypothetical protein T492DRAFT_914197 [Pavlovales sp. CCMP2436]